MAEKYKNKLGQPSYPYKKPFRIWNRAFLKFQDKACTYEKKSCECFFEYVFQMFDKYSSVVDISNKN